MASDALSIGRGEPSAVLEDLTRDSFRLLLPVTAAVTWAWALAVLYGMERYTLHAYGVMALMAAVVWLGYRLHRRWLRLAIAIYLLGAMAATTTIALSFGGVGTLYLYVVILPVAATLASPRAVWALATVAGALVVAVGRGAYGLPLVQLALPVTTMFLAALALWLGSQRLFTALAWALNMTREAQKSAAMAREHRAEVRRVLKSLDEAYVRLERANEALIYAREAAERAYQFKAEFVANVSHELRTPLNLIVGFSELIATAPESYGGAVLPNPYRGDVMAIYRSARHLADLINDVLDLSRLEAGAMPLLKEEADIGEVAREAAEMVRGLAEARGLRLELSVPEVLPAVRLDRTRIRQVLLNLLTNATRFTERGWIALRIRAEDREVVVTVEDSGEGIPPDRLARAFEAFSQLDDDHVRQGSGLGLAVSKRFVELHGGRMWIDSKPGRGTTVAFSLPLAERGSGSAHRRSGTRLQRRSELPTVLVLHDDARTLSLLRRYVDACEFVLATTPHEAREKVGEVFPVAVVVDVGWPGGAPAVAEIGLPEGTPVVSCPLPSMRRFAVLLGADDYLAKPVTREHLAEVLARLPRLPQSALIVDDDPDVVRLLARLLVGCCPEVRVSEAFGGRAGLEAARAQQPDLVLLDLYMPEVSGYEFLEEVRRDPSLADTHVIVVSVRPTEESSVPLVGPVWLERGDGFSFTEVLQVLQSTLPVITRRSAAAPASAARRRAGHPGGPAW